MLAASPALAAEPPAEAPTATAAASAPGDVAEQIAAYLRDSPVAQLPADGAPRAAVERPLDRRPHGVVEVGVGSHGYRSVYLQTQIPLGERGLLGLAVGVAGKAWSPACAAGCRASTVPGLRGRDPGAGALALRERFRAVSGAAITGADSRAISGDQGLPGEPPR